MQTSPLPCSGGPRRGQEGVGRPDGVRGATSCRGTPDERCTGRSADLAALTRLGPGPSRRSAPYLALHSVEPDRTHPSAGTSWMSDCRCTRSFAVLALTMEGHIAAEQCEHVGQWRGRGLPRRSAARRRARPPRHVRPVPTSCAPVEPACLILPLAGCQSFPFNRMYDAAAEHGLNPRDAGLNAA